MAGLCIDFGGTAIKIGVLDGGTVLASEEFPVRGSRDDLAAVEAAVAAMAPQGLTSTAIAVPGVVDRERGSLVAAHDKYDYAIGMDLRAWGRDAFGLPCAIENDARAALLGETTFGCAPGERNAVIIILGTGIGTAAMIDGQLLRGVHDNAGILGGHVTVDLEGGVCNCGNIGCAEALASSWALPGIIEAHPGFADSEPWRERLRSGPVGFKELFEAQDPLAAEVRERVLRAWGAATVSLCHAYDPEVVIFAGGVMRAADRIVPSLSEYVSRHLWSFFPRPRFATSPAPHLSVLLGLSVLATAQRKDER